MKTAKEIYGDSYYYSYQPMLNEFGEIVCQEEAGDYQGDTFVIYRDGQRYGYLNFGWGSCSACDALQGCNNINEVQELMDNLYNSIVWQDDLDSFKQWFTSHDWEGDYCWHLSEFMDFYKQVVKILDSLSEDEDGNEED